MAHGKKPHKRVTPYKATQFEAGENAHEAIIDSIEPGQNILVISEMDGFIGLAIGDPSKPRPDAVSLLSPYGAHDLARRLKAYANKLAPPPGIKN